MVSPEPRCDFPLRRLLPCLRMRNHRSPTSFSYELVRVFNLGANSGFSSDGAQKDGACATFLTWSGHIFCGIPVEDMMGHVYTSFEMLGRTITVS